jgi:hypothetical protein
VGEEFELRSRGPFHVSHGFFAVHSLGWQPRGAGLRTSPPRMASTTASTLARAGPPPPLQPLTPPPRQPSCKSSGQPLTWRGGTMSCRGRAPLNIIKIQSFLYPIPLRILFNPLFPKPSF